MVAAAYSSLLLMLFAGGLTLTAALYSGRVRQRRPLLEMQPRRPVPWTLVDLFPVGFFLLLNFAGVVASMILEFGSEKLASPPRPLTVAQARDMMLLDTGMKFVLGGVTIAWIFIRHRPSMTDWGWSLSNLRENIVIGAGVFLVIYLPTIALQVSLVVLLNWRYDHPLIELTTRTKDPGLFALAVFVAAIMAPLFEEFVFRGLLQGWLEKALGTNTQPPIAAEVLESSLATVSQPSASTGIDPNPYASPDPIIEIANPANELVTLKTPPPNWAAIAISSIVFALMHFSHGPAWIPLLLFGATLGYAYQRTHSLWPGIIAHMLLNGITMVGLWVQVFSGG